MDSLLSEGEERPLFVDENDESISIVHMDPRPILSGTQFFEEFETGNHPPKTEDPDSFFRLPIASPHEPFASPAWDCGLQDEEQEEQHDDVEEEDPLDLDEDLLEIDGQAQSPPSVGSASCPVRRFNAKRLILDAISNDDPGSMQSILDCHPKSIDFTFGRKKMNIAHSAIAGRAFQVVPLVHRRACWLFFQVDLDGEFPLDKAGMNMVGGFDVTYLIHADRI